MALALTANVVMNRWSKPSSILSHFRADTLCASFRIMISLMPHSTLTSPRRNFNNLMFAMKSDEVFNTGELRECTIFSHSDDRSLTRCARVCKNWTDTSRGMIYLTLSPCSKSLDVWDITINMYVSTAPAYLYNSTPNFNPFLISVQWFVYSHPIFPNWASRSRGLYQTHNLRQTGAKDGDSQYYKRHDTLELASRHCSEKARYKPYAKPSAPHSQVGE